MTPFGNKILIETAITRVKNLSLMDRLSYREIDGLIALAVFSQPTTDASWVQEDSRVPYAMVTNSRRTYAVTDTIEFENPLGPGFILMNEAKVPHFTTKIDDALRLLYGKTRWSISLTGLVRCEYMRMKFFDRLCTPQLGLCSVGLQLRHALFFSEPVISELNLTLTA